MATLRIIVSCGLVTLAGCPRTSDVGAQPDAGAADGVPRTQVGAGEGALLPPGASCRELSGIFRKTWKQAPGTCAADADCGCFNPVVEEAGCGGVTDRETATKLAKIESAFQASSCRWPHLCGAQVCSPRCKAGRCIEHLDAP
jgi:hypothetical protein